MPTLAEFQSLFAEEPLKKNSFVVGKKICVLTTRDNFNGKVKEITETDVLLELEEAGPYDVIIPFCSIASVLVTKE